MSEPVYFQTIAQVQSSAVKHDPEIIYFNAQNVADFFAFKTFHLAQRESADRPLRQWRETVVKNLPKITPLHQFRGRRMPIVWRPIVVPMTLPRLGSLEKLSMLWSFVKFFADWRLTTDATKVINDLVF